MILKYSVGIDISMKNFQATIGSIDSNQVFIIKARRKFENKLAGFKLFLKWCDKQHKDRQIPIGFCMEVTGVYHEELAFFLHAKGKQVAIVLANLAAKYLESLGNKSKTDPIDSVGLARMGAERNLKVWNPPAKFYAQLRSLTRQHQSLQEQKTQIINRQHAKAHSAHGNRLVDKQLKASVRLIDRQLSALESAITDHIDQNQDIRQKVDKICVLKGVAELTVAVLIAETFGFELFNNIKQLISYSGYDVVIHQSGKKNGQKGISKRGNSRIRRILHMPAFNVVRWQKGEFLNLYERTIKRHGLKMKSYVAIQKKLLAVIFACWKKNEPYQEQYYKQFIQEQVTSYSFLQKNSSEQSGAIPGSQKVKVQSLTPISLK